ncbi:MAG: hypothetical protein ACREH8_03330 [Opitutaceae bacterium]
MNDVTLEITGEWADLRVRVTPNGERRDVSNNPTPTLAVFEWRRSLRTREPTSLNSQLVNSEAMKPGASTRRFR